MADIDLDAVNDLLDEVGKADTTSRRSPRRRSRSRGRDDGRRRFREEPRDRRDRGRDRRRSRSRDEDLAAKAKAHREDERYKRVLEDEHRQKQDRARRDDCTVLVLNLNAEADERNLFQFFSERAGKVRDVQVIRDPRSGRSKGVAFVEFNQPECVFPAMACSDQPILGYPIKVQASQADKNRAYDLPNMVPGLMPTPVAPVDDVPMRLKVWNLVGALAKITEAELTSLFSPFGEIATVSLKKDPYTNQSKGYAYVDYARSFDAKEAIATMNNFDFAGGVFKVAIHNEPDEPSEPPTCLRFGGMFDPKDPDTKDPDFFPEVEEDVKEECGKHGTVKRVLVDKHSADGCVLVEFSTAAAAAGARKAMDGREFGGTRISVAGVTSDAFAKVQQ